MKVYLPGPPRRHQVPLRIPMFHAVPARARRDGWTPLRQAEFIGYLAQTRSVAEAARRVGMARESAYRLRQRQWSEGFCAAWNAALGKRVLADPVALRKVTIVELRWRLDSGKWQVLITARRFAGLRHKADNAALFELLKRLGCNRAPRYDDDD